MKSECRSIIEELYAIAELERKEYEVFKVELKRCADEKINKTFVIGETNKDIYRRQRIVDLAKRLIELNS